MHLKFRGALTFDTDEALEKCLQEIKQTIQNSGESVLSMDHIEPLGLHLTVNHSGSATPAQRDASRQLLEMIAGAAYSGYVDMIVDETDQERFHAKEIAPKEVRVEDISTG